MQVTRRRFVADSAAAGGVLCVAARSARAGETEQRVCGWTREEIRSRLGMSAAVYQKVPLGEREIAAIREAGLTRIELVLLPRTFDFRDKAQREEVLAACRKQGVEVVSAHANLALKLEAEERTVREAAIREVIESVGFLEEAGGKVLVGHFGHSDQSRAVVEAVLTATDGSAVRVATENMRGGLEPYAALVDKVKSPRFGLTVDIGHARDPDGVNPFTKPGRAREALAEAKGRVIHLHLHETFNLDQKPDHRPPLHPEGLIQWGEVFAGLRDIEYAGCLLFEDGRGENPEEWTRMTAAFPESFVAKYG